MSKSTLYILGRPLSENTSVTPRFLKILESSQVIIGESKRVTSRILDKIPLSSEVHCFTLDNQSPREKTELEIRLKQIAKDGGVVSLFSDMGMPILFDPGAAILELAKSFGFTIRCLPGPTSWGTACALTGWNPPFTLVGFLPQKTAERATALQKISQWRGHLILMDTPYRFHTLLGECLKTFGPQHPAFLGWEIGNPEELYLWGTLQNLEKETTSHQLKKGEFILIIQDPSVK